MQTEFLLAQIESTEGANVLKPTNNLCNNEHRLPILDHFGITDLTRVKTTRLFISMPHVSLSASKERLAYAKKTIYFPWVIGLPVHKSHMGPANARKCQAWALTYFS